MSPANMQAVGPFAPAVHTKVGSEMFDKLERLNKAIFKLEEEVKRQREAEENYQWHNDKDRWLELRPRLAENEKELKELRALAAAQQKKREEQKKAIFKLEEEAERLEFALNCGRWHFDCKERWEKKWRRFTEVEKDLKRRRALVAPETSKLEEEKEAAEKKRAAAEKAAAEEKKRAAERAAAEQKRRQELLKQKEEEKKALQAQLSAEKKHKAEAEAAAKKYKAELAAAEEKRRAAEKAAAEEKRKQHLLKQKEEQINALKAQVAAEQKRKAEAEAVGKKLKTEMAAAEKKRKEEWAAAEEKHRRELLKRADEELKYLKDELAEKKKLAYLHASQRLKDETNRKLMEAYKAEARERERAVEEAHQKLEDAERRLRLESEERRNRSYEAWKALERERKREVEEAERRAAREEKKVSDARKEAERQASLVQKPKEVSFDSSHNRTYDLSPAPHNYRQPEQPNVKHSDNVSQQKSYYPSDAHSRSQNPPHFSDVKTASHPQSVPHQQVSQPKQRSSSQTYPAPHQKDYHPPRPSASLHDHQAPVGLSGLPAEYSVTSQSPVVAPWEQKNWSSHDYPLTSGTREQSYRDVPSHKPSDTEKKWSTPVIPAWNGPAQQSSHTDEKRFASPVPVSRPKSPPKEKWSLPPSPPHIPNERKDWDHSNYRSPEVDVRTPRETEEEKLRREVAEYKKKCAKLAADLERKKRVSGADSVATWQTGTKSIWEDPTKDTPKGTSEDTRKDTSKHDAQGHRSETPISVQNLRRRQPSAGQHRSSNNRTEAQRQHPSVDHKTERPESRASTHTRYFEAEEYISSDEEATPRPKISKPDTHYGWRKTTMESIPPYVPPTPHRRPSPPPVLPPTPPRGSRVSTPATLRPGPNQKASSKQEIKTPKLTGIPGSWREDIPGKDSSENRWPANVSTPSVKSPPIAVHKAKDKFTPERYIPPYYAPKDVPPPGSYLSAGPQQQYAPFYQSHAIPDIAAVPRPGPSYPIHHPLYAPQVQGFTPKIDVEAGPSGHGGSFPSWADPTAAQSLGGTQAPPRKDKGKGKARW